MIFFFLDSGAVVQIPGFVFLGEKSWLRKDHTWESFKNEFDSRNGALEIKPFLTLCF